MADFFLIDRKRKIQNTTSFRPIVLAGNKASYWPSRKSIKSCKMHAWMASFHKSALYTELRVQNNSILKDFHVSCNTGNTKIDPSFDILLEFILTSIYSILCKDFLTSDHCTVK